jgi:hypothetical protein
MLSTCPVPDSAFAHNFLRIGYDLFTCVFTLFDFDYVQYFIVFETVSMVNILNYFNDTTVWCPGLSYPPDAT